MKTSTKDWNSSAGEYRGSCAVMSQPGSGGEERQEVLILLSDLCHVNVHSEDHVRWKYICRIWDRLSPSPPAAGGNLCTFIWMSFPFVQSRREQERSPPSLLSKLSSFLPAVSPPPPYPPVIDDCYFDREREREIPKCHDWEYDLQLHVKLQEMFHRSWNKKVSSIMMICFTLSPSSSFVPWQHVQKGLRVSGWVVVSKTACASFADSTLASSFRSSSSRPTVRHLRQDCGPDAMRFFEQNLNEMSNSLIHRHCISFADNHCDEMSETMGPGSSANSSIKSLSQGRNGRKSKPLRSSGYPGPPTVDLMLFHSSLLTLLLFLLILRTWWIDLLFSYSIVPANCFSSLLDRQYRQ